MLFYQAVYKAGTHSSSQVPSRGQTFSNFFSRSSSSIPVVVDGQDNLF